MWYTTSSLTGDFPENSKWARYAKYPWPAGYCNIGEVVQVGSSEVTSVQTGDTVASAAGHTCFYTLDAGSLVKVPKTISTEDASFAVIATGVLNSVRKAEVSTGSSVVVAGLGLLGQFACLWSRLAGGFPVVAVDISQGRLEIAKKICQATILLNPKEQDVEKGIYKITKGRMADIVFEVTGNPKLIPDELNLVKPQGKFIVLSSPRGKSEIDFHDLVNSPSVHIIGTHFVSAPEFETPYNPWTRKRNTELYFDLLESGLVQVKGLVTHRYHWEEAISAYEMLLNDRTQALGVILNWDGDNV